MRPHKYFPLFFRGFCNWFLSVEWQKSLWWILKHQPKVSKLIKTRSSYLWSVMDHANLKKDPKIMSNIAIAKILILLHSRMEWKLVPLWWVLRLQPNNWFNLSQTAGCPVQISLSLISATLPCVLRELVLWRLRSWNLKRGKFGEIFLLS